MSNDDFDIGLEVNDICDDVWPGPHPSWSGQDWMRRALVRAAVEITHEN